MNVQATANALFTAREEMKTVKRNKSGSFNQTSIFPVRQRAHAALKDAGNTWQEAHDMLKAIGAV